MAKAPKTKVVKVIQGRYAHGPYGWEDQGQYEKADWPTAVADLKEYRQSARPDSGMSYRIITRRVPTGD